MEKRVIIFGDLHGCLDELKDLLDKVKYDPSYDRLISVGDLVDRGDYSVECIRYLRSLNAEIVLGNHEDKYIRYHRHELKIKEDPKYRNPMSRFPDRKMVIYNQLTEEDFTYLDSLPSYISINEYLKVIHAGVQPDVCFNKQPISNYIYLRYIKDNGSVFAGTASDKSDLTFWAELWTGPECIVYGHFVHNLSYPTIHKKTDQVWCLGLDSGCCFGGFLSAVVFSEEDLAERRIGKIIRVRARREYMVWREDGRGFNDY